MAGRKRRRSKGGAASARATAARATKKSKTPAAKVTIGINKVEPADERTLRSKQKVRNQLAIGEEAYEPWLHSFKDGDTYEAVPFEQLSVYGPDGEDSRYVLATKAGEGSFSCVYKGWDTDEDCWVAMKFTLSSGKEEYTILRQLHDASEACSDGEDCHNGMNANAIIMPKACFDCVTSLGTIIKCIVMEYKPHCLSSLITCPSTEQPLGVRHLIHISRQLLSAVAFLENQGHIHCDIKPQNIVYENEDGKLNVRLADFGSCIVEGSGYLNDYIVTRPYRPPEVMLGLCLTSAVDIWSVGCVIMELILGQTLFSSTDHFQLITTMVETLGMPSNHFIQRCLNWETYFVRPRALTCPDAFDHPPLPAQISVKRSRTKRGTLYYHDANTAASKFARPEPEVADYPSCNAQLPSCMGRQPSIGNGWTMRLSSTTNNWYYANSHLGATQWQRPVKQTLRAKVEQKIGGYMQVKQFQKLFSVLEKMLSWDPDERITAQEGLEAIS